MTEPGVKFTVQVSCPVFSTSDAQLCLGTQETDPPVRWKLWNVELSSSSSVYAPWGSVRPSRFWPFGSLSSIVKSSSTCAVSTGRSYCGVQNGPGGSCCRIRNTLFTSAIWPMTYMWPQASSPNEVGKVIGMSVSTRLSVASGIPSTFDEICPLQ